MGAAEKKKQDDIAAMAEQIFDLKQQIKNLQDDTKKAKKAVESGKTSVKPNPEEELWNLYSIA